MAQVYIGLGSNQGKRLKNLSQALDSIKKISGVCVEKTSCVYESPALLPPKAPEEWNLPFLNAALKATCTLPPEELLKALKNTEQALGRKPSFKKWQPRTIDLDILLFADDVIKTKNLSIPHPGLCQRDFVLSPLKELCSLKKVPGTGGKTLLQLARRAENKLPAWMHIVNVTPDSFSDGGDMNQNTFYKLLKNLPPDAQILDIGGESTRPGAKPVAFQEEQKRLSPFLKMFFDFYKNKNFAPKISVDTRHSETARWALKWGVDMINDVSGLSDEGMVGEVLKHSSSDYVLMHSLSVPASSKHTMPLVCDTVKEIKNWLSLKMDLLDSQGVDLSRVVFDPGIGFGKNPAQSLEILSRMEEFLNLPVRILVGHSRKSVMKNFSSPVAKDRDMESMGISLKLALQGVDIIRTHKAFMHSRMFLGFKHL